MPKTDKIEAIMNMLDDTIRAMKNGENTEEVLNSALNQTRLDGCQFSKDDIIALTEHIVFGLYDGKFPEDTGFYSGPTMILFTQRMQIENLYLNWCKENGVADKPNSLVTFMQINDWLNEEQIMADLNLVDSIKKKLRNLHLNWIPEDKKE